VFDEPTTTSDLLEVWREATRAAELAERLARLAADRAHQTDLDASGAEEVAALAEQSAAAATAAAERARAAADHARGLAHDARSVDVRAAVDDQASTLAAEGAGRDWYEAAEADVRERHADDDNDTPEAGRG
jgi:hypothetical protein